MTYVTLHAFYLKSCLSFGVISNHLESLESWVNKISCTINMQRSLLFLCRVSDAVCMTLIHPWRNYITIVTFLTLHALYLKSCLSTLLLVLDSMNISSETIAPIVQQYAQMTRHNKEPKLYIPSSTKGQLISKCLFSAIVSTKKPKFLP